MKTCALASCGAPFNPLHPWSVSHFCSQACRAIQVRIDRNEDEGDFSPAGWDGKTQYSTHDWRPTWVATCIPCGESIYFEESTERATTLQQSGLVKCARCHGAVSIDRGDVGTVSSVFKGRIRIPHRSGFSDGGAA